MNCLCSNDGPCGIPEHRDRWYQRKIAELQTALDSRVERTTVLDGYYATGDHTCFCFDRHATPGEHYARASLYQHHDPDECRVYPHELIPSGTDGLRGRWEITVKFRRCV